MNTEIHEDMTAVSGYGEEGRGQQTVKCYWLFDTENGAPSAPSTVKDMNIQSQGEE